jgi:hypothetical protein
MKSPLLFMLFASLREIMPLCPYSNKLYLCAHQIWFALQASNHLLVSRPQEVGSN